MILHLLGDHGVRLSENSSLEVHVAVLGPSYLEQTVAAVHTGGLHVSSFLKVFTKESLTTSNIKDMDFMLLLLLGVKLVDNGHADLGREASLDILLLVVS